MRILAVIVAAGLLISCGAKAPVKAERTCEVQGEVIRLDAQVRTATLKHGKICDWMEAMSMEFPVRKQADFDLLKPGQKIVATVHIGDPEFWLSDVHPAN